MPAEAVRLYRPAKVSDGEGGFTEAFGAAVTLYGTLVVHKSATSLEGVDAGEDVAVGDVLVAEE